MSKPRIMILCGRSARHLYVANRLCVASEPLAIVQETGREWKLRKALKMARPSYLVSKGWRWLRQRSRQVLKDEAHFFFPNRPPRLDRPDLVREVPYINHPDVLHLARTLKPDLICVFGTSLIRGELLKEGRLGIVNLHGGLSPEYRGADCTFWALYNGEPDKVGCTLHYIDDGIDTGGLIAHVSPAVEEGDGERVLFWRGVRDSAEVYAEAISRIAAGQRAGTKQPDKGRLYQVRQRGFRHERSLSSRLPRMLAGIHLPPRVRWFLHEEQTAPR